MPATNVVFVFEDPRLSFSAPSDVAKACCDDIIREETKEAGKSVEREAGKPVERKPGSSLRQIVSIPSKAGERSHSHGDASSWLNTMD